MTESTTPPPTTPPPGAPGGAAPTVPPVDPPAPVTPSVGDPAADDDAFTSDRQKRRFSELVGRVGVRERERDEARGRVTQLLTREAERHAANALSAPTDLWLGGATLDDVLNDAGDDVDPAKVKALVDQLTAARPGLRVQQQPSPLPGGHRLPPPAKPATFAETIQELTRGRI